MSARGILAGLLGSVALAAATGSAAQPVPDLERGRAFYQNHCIVCHTPKVHRREPPLALTVDELRAVVTLWARQQGLGWCRDDIEDVVQYLDRAHYQFPR